MGDRGNIGIRQPNEDAIIYLYTHWEGSYICSTLAIGLAKCREAGRLDDPSYATRIIFDTLTTRYADGYAHAGLDGRTTGYGIAVNYPPDNQHEIPYVNWQTHGTEPHIEYGCGRFSVEAFITAYTPTPLEEAKP